MNRQDLFRIARNRIRTTPDAKLTPQAVDATGSTINVLVNGASAMAEECEARSVARYAAHLVSTARDDDLDRLILERSFGKLARKGASAAVFAAQVSRTGTAAGTVTAGTQLIAGGLTFTLDSPVIFADGQKGPIDASFTCQSLGSAGNLEPSAITGLKKDGLFDSTLTVTASVPSAGGADREKDSEYKARYALWDSGTDRNLDFLAAGALAVGGISYALAIEDIDGDGQPVGSVALYVGDGNGRANAALLSRVRIALRGFRLAGQWVRLFGTSPSLQQLVLAFAVLDGFSTSDVQAAGRAAAVASVNALGPGASLEPAAVGVALKAVPGVSFLPAYPNGVVTPSAPVAGSSATLFRTRLDLVTMGP